MSVSPDFELPPTREASRPPEARGLARDEVRLLVARGSGEITHTRFTRFAEHLEPGDLLVANDSATLPAAVDGRRRSGAPVTVHFSGPLPGADPARALWVVELRPGGRADGPLTDAGAGEQIRLPDDARLALVNGYPDGGRSSRRLWCARVDGIDDVPAYLHRHGRPITYSYVDQPWPLDAYQTVFATTPGSAEMPSAGRPFTPATIRDLVRRGVVIATITLHTGVSSTEAGERPVPERYDVPPTTAALVNLTRSRGNRVVAIGTTATRALETVAAPDGVVRAGSGVTDLVLRPDRPARVVTGLLTGWHAPGASHLWLLQAVAGPALVTSAYDAAVATGYLWHEFGDSCLLLPDRR